MALETVKFLPNVNVNDGDQVIDNNGNIFEYDSNQSQWVYRGVVEVPAVVTEENDGLVSPAIYRKIKLLESLIDKGYDFSLFKLQSGSQESTPYFYNFTSTDDLIDFTVEGEDQLRIEIDRGRLIHRLTSVCCVGPKGVTGPQGEAGIDGIPSADELLKKPSVDLSSNSIIIEDQVNSNIETDISLRIFDETEQQVIEARVSPFDDTEEVIINVVDGVDIDESTVDIAYNNETKDFLASFSVSSNLDISGWEYKLRQVGPQGPPGNDGNPFLEVNTELISDNSLISPEAIVSMRRDGLNNINFLSREIFDNICVSKLTATSDGLPPSDLSQANYVAVEVTNRECKDIGKFNFEIPEFDLPTLELPIWSPPAGCGSRSLWSNYRFKWWEQSDVQTIFRILPASRPPEACCSNSFYWCPNVGDQPCGVVGPEGKKVQIEMPVKSTGGCICECPDPIEFELQSGGFTFEPIDTTTELFDSQEVVAISVDSVLNGAVDRYNMEIKAKGELSIEIKVTPNPEVCGGLKAEKESCAYVESDVVSTIFYMRDITGNASSISQGGYFQADEIPLSNEFFVTTNRFTNDIGEEEFSTTDLQLKFMVNATQLDLCRGYRVSIVVSKV